MRIWLVSGLVGVAAITAGSCASGDGSNPTPPSQQTPRPAEPSKENIDKLCRYFYLRPHEVLLTSGAEGQVNLYRELPGIPQSLKQASHNYYSGEPLDGNPAKPFKGDRKVRLDGKYSTMIQRCQQNGWSV